MARIVVQFLDGSEQITLAGVGGKADGGRIDAGIARRSVLGADIDAAGGIVTDQYDGQARGKPGGGHLRGDLGAQAWRRRFCR